MADAAANINGVLARSSVAVLAPSGEVQGPGGDPVYGFRYIGAGAPVSGAAGWKTIPFPAGVTSEDWFVIVSDNGNTSTNFDPPSGWSDWDSGGTPWKTFHAYGVTNPPEPSVYCCNAQMFAFRGMRAGPGLPAIWGAAYSNQQFGISVGVPSGDAGNVALAFGIEQGRSTAPSFSWSFGPANQIIGFIGPADGSNTSLFVAYGRLTETNGWSSGYATEGSWSGVFASMIHDPNYYYVPAGSGSVQQVHDDTTIDAVEATSSTGDILATATSNATVTLAAVTASCSTGEVVGRVGQWVEPPDTFVGYGAPATGSLAVKQVPLPEGIEAGDFLVLVVCRQRGGWDPEDAWPDGWVAYYDDYSYRIFIKFANGNDTAPSIKCLVAQVLAFRGIVNAGAETIYAGVNTPFGYVTDNIQLGVRVDNEPSYQIFVASAYSSDPNAEQGISPWQHMYFPEDDITMLPLVSSVGEDGMKGTLSIGYNYYRSTPDIPGGDRAVAIIAPGGSFAGASIAVHGPDPVWVDDVSAETSIAAVEATASAQSVHAIAAVLATVPAVSAHASVGKLVALLPDRTSIQTVSAAAAAGELTARVYATASLVAVTGESSAATVHAYWFDGAKLSAVTANSSVTGLLSFGSARAMMSPVVAATAIGQFRVKRFPPPPVEVAGAEFVGGIAGQGVWVE